MSRASPRGPEEERQCTEPEMVSTSGGSSLSWNSKVPPSVPPPSQDKAQFNKAKPCFGILLGWGWYQKGITEFHNFVGVLTLRALLFGVPSRAPDFWQLPNEQRVTPSGMISSVF